VTPLDLALARALLGRASQRVAPAAVERDLFDERLLESARLWRIFMAIGRIL
jgi:hypothetical protein